VKAGRRAEEAPPRYALSAWTRDMAAEFAARARSTSAEVHEIAQIDDAPEAIWSILVKQNAARHVHIPPGSPANELPWQRAPGLSVKQERPSGSDSAVSFANYAIAETGTLVFASGTDSPPATFLLPETHVAIVRADQIVAGMEEAFARLRAGRGALPRAVNLVSGPSRTGDIEQTIVLGAHGPRRVHIVVVG